MWHPTSDPYPTHHDMPLLPWLWRFGLFRVKSRFDQLLRRLYCRIARPPIEAIRFDVYGGKSVYIRQCISLQQAIPHLAAGKRIAINSRLPSGRHALMLDWDGVSEQMVREWCTAAGGRWHLYRTDRGFHFICTDRTLTFRQLVRAHYRTGFHENVGVHVSLFYGHGSLRVSPKQAGVRDISKLGDVGEGEEIGEVLELVAAHDAAVELLQGK
ncbi:hypothetical protein HS125_12355 [bacterium]|nr:hypothetical protein [bacterium]